MLVPSTAIYLVKKYEGFSASVYKCPAGYKTIGYGHVVQKTENLPAIIDHNLAEKLLERDLLIALANVNSLILVPINENQLSSLLSFTFNLGGAALERSTLRQKINRGDFQAAEAEFPKWVYAGAKKLPGLVRRRAEERQIFASS